jgi:hypothetical protein
MTKPTESSSTIINILRSEVTFWITIIALVVTAVIAFTRLEGTVFAMNEKGIKLRNEYETTATLLIEVRDSQIRSEQDILYIKEVIKTLK